ncbi:helix-turn-helix domain-containing protein [Clostridium tagluense]|uniref:PucR family transcriptional regulator n=1 Tax=Clostridium TaxID=1485 RepID=UPI0013E98505|nr:MULTISPECIES: helix-turn-helix domain-containing protein [Clostridium]MBU3129143.1 helix-turn-helix domain-containing protein [Clostridium tagluense]MBZ9625789.1 helix-turn-helix domain-containing protein [Clostridium sp. FP2]MCB2311360.1 helix-turn-helix domain-containing protein [Clostridium tagluense]MCB2315998.1 helix-turn-helix domain-containing protein [Clostridium tagluense]MCB2320936.1 helix-turn-helix domain-containing protein [Clostridium tagluense]
MYNFTEFLRDLSHSSNIPFNVVTEDGIALYISDLDIENSHITNYTIMLGRVKGIISLEKKYGNCTSLLQYVIENKYTEHFLTKEQAVIDILENREISIDNINHNLPFLEDGCYTLLVSVDGSKYESLSVIKQIYDNEPVVSLIYNDSIIVIGDFEEVEEHAESIKESISSDLYCKCYVSYADRTYDIKGLKKAYNDAVQCMELGKKFDIKDHTFSYNKMLFEKIVYNVDVKIKQELLGMLKDKFDALDSEMIITIEQFVNCGLNISDAARKLYVHRNTLIYRLDKIKKETNFDIRDFKDASVFLIGFLIWKENKE